MCAICFEHGEACSKCLYAVHIWGMERVRCLWCLQDKDMRANGNSSMAQPAVNVAKAVYVRQLMDMSTELPASFGEAAIGAMLPSMLSKPSPHLRKAQEQHRAMLQASIKDVMQAMPGSSSAAEPARCNGSEPCRLCFTAK